MEGIDLCRMCEHRADSIKRVQKWRERGAPGMVCDPAPRSECKDHEGYGRNGTKHSCRDFRWTDEGRAVFFSLSKPCIKCGTRFSPHYIEIEVCDACIQKGVDELVNNPPDNHELHQSDQN